MDGFRNRGIGKRVEVILILVCLCGVVKSGFISDSEVDSLVLSSGAADEDYLRFINRNSNAKSRETKKFSAKIPQPLPISLSSSPDIITPLLNYVLSTPTVSDSKSNEVSQQSPNARIWSTSSRQNTNNKGRSENQSGNGWGSQSQNGNQGRSNNNNNNKAEITKIVYVIDTNLNDNNAGNRQNSQSQYGAPEPVLRTQSNQHYGAPESILRNQPNSQYGAPDQIRNQQYGAPEPVGRNQQPIQGQQYGAPESGQRNSAPNAQYGVPEPMLRNQPVNQQYGAPVPQTLQGQPNNIGFSEDFRKSLSRLVAEIENFESNQATNKNTNNNYNNNNEISNVQNTNIPSNSVTNDFGQSSYGPPTFTGNGWSSSSSSTSNNNHNNNKNTNKNSPFKKLGKFFQNVLQNLKKPLRGFKSGIKFEFGTNLVPSQSASKSKGSSSPSAQQGDSYSAPPQQSYSSTPVQESYSAPSQAPSFSTSHQQTYTAPISQQQYSSQQPQLPMHATKSKNSPNAAEEIEVEILPSVSLLDEEFH